MGEAGSGKTVVAAKVVAVLRLDVATTMASLGRGKFFSRVDRFYSLYFTRYFHISQ